MHEESSSTHAQQSQSSPVYPFGSVASYHNTQHSHVQPKNFTNSNFAQLITNAILILCESPNKNSLSSTTTEEISYNN